MKEFICVQPDYVERFQCDGSSCGSLCCRNWRAAIDGGTYDRYLKSDRLRDKILPKIFFEPEIDSYSFLQDSDGRCAFLRGDMLCALQREHGAGILPDVCAEYPRKTNKFPGFIERALCMTCPVAEKIALLGREPVRFVETRVKSGRESYFQPADNEEALLNTGFLDVQGIGITILQNRILTIDARLICLGRFLDAADDLVSAGRPDEISELYSDCAFAEKGYPKFQFDRYAEFMLDLMSFLQKNAKDDEEDTAIYMELAKSAFSGSRSDVMTGFHEKILKNYSHILENYLVNEFFMKLYPCCTVGNFIHNYKIFTALYKELEFALAAENFLKAGGADADDILRAVRWISVRTNHFTGYIENVGEYLSSRGGSLPEFMGALLGGEAR